MNWLAHVALSNNEPEHHLFTFILNDLKCVLENSNYSMVGIKSTGRLFF